MLKEKDYQAIINLYVDKYSNNGSKFPLNLEQTNAIVELIKKHINIVKRYSKDRQRILNIYTKSVSTKGIIKYLKLPTMQASLVYDVVKQWLS